MTSRLLDDPASISLYKSALRDCFPAFVMNRIIFLKIKAMILLLSALFVSNFAYALEFNPVPGGLALIRIAGIAQPKPPAVYFGSKRVPVIMQVNAWRALVGLPHDQAPGRYVIHYVNDDKKTKSLGFRVKPRKRPEIDVPQRPERSSLFYLSRELEDVISDSVTRWRDAGSFITRLTPPTQGTITAAYGELTGGGADGLSSHAQKGLEIEVPAFDPINAPADAKVIEVITQQVHGHTLIFDHGQSLMSVLIGIASPLVSVGQFVSRGESVGQAAANAADEDQTSSETTRVSTILWRVYLNGNAVDPQVFLR